MSDPAILLQDVWKSYGAVQALRGIDLEVPAGSIYGFLGPNGAGKTTTIRCLLDLIRPQRGRVRVLGVDPQRDPVAVRARCGYLPGELEFDENLTGRGLLRLLDDLRGRSAGQNRIGPLAERLDFDLSVPIKNLSKGNKQKLAVIQAFMHRPELLLLDEPTQGLDPLMQHEVLDLVREARGDGATVFFSSHILQEVQSVADRAAIVRAGQIVEEVDTSGLLSRSMRRVRLSFKQPVDPEPLTKIRGVHLLSSDNGTSVLLRVEGEMEELIHGLAQYPVSDFETERPTLEEVFLAYYRTDTEGQES